jgi:hypothetical protein
MNTLIDEYQNVKLQLAKLKKRKTAIEAELAKFAGETITGERYEISVTAFNKAGSVNWKTLVESLDINPSYQLVTAHTRPTTSQIKYTVREIAA